MDSFSKLTCEYKKLWPEGSFKLMEPMRQHTSFRIGGPVRLMFFPKTEEEAADIASLIKKYEVKSLVIGNGTNLLVSEDELNIAVIKLGADFSNIVIKGKEITVQAGALLSKIASKARDASLSGLEFAHGIPGSLGGAVYMNAGAYGGEMKDVVLSVTSLDKDLKIKERTAEECGFSYRTSVFEDAGEIILSVKLGLKEGDGEDIARAMEELIKRRREKQPLEYPSAGSAFKRPKEGYAAAMIDEAGLKGFRIGNAAVSDKHAGFVVNLGGASFNDVLEVLEHVKNIVYARTGVLLEPEVRIIR